MKLPLHPVRIQRGAALVVALIMLVLITALVAGAFTLSSVNLKSVGNMQFRDEAIAAGNQAIEQVISSNFTANPQAQGFDIDIDKDGKADYQVNFAVPVCLTATLIPNAGTPPSSISLGSLFNLAVANFFRSVWQLDATVTDTAGNGAAVRVRQGVAVLINQATFNAFCTGP